MRSVDSLLVHKGMGRLVFAVLVNVLQESNEETRRPVMSVVLNRAPEREP